MKHILITLLAIFTMTVSSVSFATTHTNPTELLESVTEQLFVDIGKVNSKGNASIDAMSGIVKTRLLPHMDIKFVSFKLLGKHIKGLKRPQAVAFIDAVEHYLTVTYAGALMKYTGQQVVFESNVPSQDEFATVKTQIIDSNAPTIDLHFKLRQGKDQQWKVYDIVAEGISLLSAKQKEVIQRISEVGIEQVTQELASK